MTGKVSAVFGIAELRNDSAPHQDGQARSGGSSEEICRQEDGRDVTTRGFVPPGSECIHSPLLIKCILLWLSLEGTRHIKLP